MGCDQARGKNIVLCFDGTGNEFGPNKTNVRRLSEALAKDERQVTFYDPGIGTFSSLGLPFAQRLGAVLGKASGLGLRHNLTEAYSFLMDEYEPGDRIFLFGFSRGAFTARVLAGMLRKCGLLEQRQRNLVPYAVKIYNQHRNGKEAREFKEEHGRECKPHLIGVWDTVASLGRFLGRKSFDARLNPDVKYAYHAMAIDENRRQFQVLPWDESDRAVGQVIQQVWFPGVHSDVGGFYDERELADISLEWMLDRAAAAGLRLQEDSPIIAGIRPCARGVLHESRVGFWRLWRPAPRVIPAGAKIHRSVFERPGYSLSVPTEFEITEWDGTNTSDGQVAGPFDVSPWLHLIERAAPEIEDNPERVWRQVREALAKPLPKPSFLESISPLAARKLVRQGVIMDVPGDALITRKGAREQEMFVVLEGELEAVDNGCCLGVMGPGELFGEISYLHPDGLRVASIHARTRSRLLVLPPGLVNEVMHQNPASASQLLRKLGGLMAERFREPKKDVPPRNRILPVI